MQDIARKAGVARSTVSMALRNHPSIPKRTCERIQAIARKMGYRPNPLVSALMANLRSSKAYQEKPSLAFLSAFQVEETVRTVPTFRRLLEGVTERAGQLGFALEVFRLGAPGMTPKRLSQVMKARSIPGFILSPLPSPTRELDFDWEDLNCVALGHTLLRPVQHKVSHHQYHGAMLALERLEQMGYHRIGMAMESGMDEKVEHNWLAGFLVREFTSPAARFPIFLSPEWSEEHFGEWFERHRPEAVVSFFPEVRQWLENLGLRIPADVGFALLDWSPEMARCAGIDQRSEMVGSAAVDLLVEQIYHNHRGIPETPKLVFIEGRWVDGETVAVRPTRKEGEEPAGRSSTSGTPGDG